MVTYNMMVLAIIALIVIFRRKMDFTQLAGGIALGLLLLPTVAGPMIVDTVQIFAAAGNDALNAVIAGVSGSFG
ncbi:MAG: hypothetical protein ACRDQ7_09290 [Haloechinothrix sp.]